MDQVTMPAPHNPKQNHLLAALPAVDYKRLLRHLELAPLDLGWAAYETGPHQDYVYFPASGIVSPLYVMRDGPPTRMRRWTWRK